MVTTLLALDLLNRKIETAATKPPSPVIERETAYFRETIGTIETPEELLEDFRLYRYVMTAFDMTEAMEAKAIVRKVLEEGADAPGALANRLADKKYKDLTNALGFSVAGNLKLTFPDFIDEIAGRYERAKLELDAGETNNAVRLASYFERKIGDAGSWFEVMADRPLREVVFTALQLPDAMQTLDVDRLRDELQARFDFANFQNAEKRAAFIERFALLSDLEGTGSAQPTSAALQLLGSPTGLNRLL